MRVTVAKWVKYCYWNQWEIEGCEFHMELLNMATHMKITSHPLKYFHKVGLISNGHMNGRSEFFGEMGCSICRIDNKGKTHF